MADVFRRCGCRDEDGKTLGAQCPLLRTDPKHGTWSFGVSLGNDPGTGKRVQVRRGGFPSKKKAQEARAKVIDDHANGRLRLPSKMTVRVYLPEWLQRRVDDGLRPSTERMYHRYIQNDIVPALGALRLAEVRRHHVDAFVRQMTADGRGATTVRRVHAVLSSAFTAAQRLDLIGDNPAARIALPKVNRSKISVWEPVQVREFLDAASANRLGVVFEIAVFTGLRRGELAGLRWEDVDLTRRELIVHGQRVQVGHDVIEGPVKTDSGQDRRVSLADEAVGALVAWRLQQAQEHEKWGPAWHDAGYVFTDERGDPLRPARLSRTFDTIVAHAGLPHMRFHDLRHEHASLLLAAGVDIAVVSKRLGHSTITVTSDLYSHLLEDANRAAAAAAESALPPRAGRAHTENPSVHTVSTRGSI